MKLVIVESPAKCSKIQGFLGQGWKVIASMGHIRALEHTLDAIGIQNDFNPKYEFIKEKGKAIKQIKEAATGVEDIYLAADDDREGENIAYSVCLLLKLNPKTAKRAVFHEITEKAIKAAVNSPRTIDMDKVNAQQARAMLDMMIGFTISPLLWRYVGPGLSAGRCQSPALRLIVEREEQIINFKSQSSWLVSAEWSANKLKFTSQMDEELEDEESAVNYMENVNTTTQGTIIDKKVSEWSEKAPQPLITSTLQQQASALYHINPKQTMQIAQKLYEAGHITYMRTDKAVISEEAQKEAMTWVKNAYGEEYIGQIELEESKKEKKSKKKTEEKGEKEGAKAQEAHEAIRPTHMEYTELEGEWSPQDKKIYKLIWQRAIQSVMSPVRGETCKVILQIDDDEFTWSKSWKHVTFDGWKIIGKVKSIESDSDEEDDTTGTKDDWKKVEAIKKGDTVKWDQMKAEPHETKATGRYTEAILVRELEKHGIGRPSTFASLLSVIQEKGYVEVKDIKARDQQMKEYTAKPSKWPPTVKEYKKKVGAEKSKMVPTDLGRSVLKFMLEHFDDLFNYKFTSQMEKRLDQVAEGKEAWKNTLKDMWASYKGRYEELSKKELPSNTTNSDRVREFTGGLKAVISKKGPLLLIEGKTKTDTKFLGWPSGIDFQAMTEEIALKFKKGEEEKADKSIIGEWNGDKITKKSGKFGEYLQVGDVSIPYIEDETIDKTHERLNSKKNGNSNTIKTYKEYEIKNGQYGPYIIKPKLKKIQFVSIPKGITIDNLTEKDVEALYKAGLEKKSTAKKYIKKEAGAK
jgi:DNA topoisomerase-1